MTIVIFKKILPLLLISSFAAQAKEDGKVLYGQLCASCHGANGEGVGNGIFPPLSGSEWLKGDPNRAAQILLHGITGPIKVKNKEYNLVMPSQGALSDAQKVAIIHFIKQEFAKETTKYSLSDLQAAKKLSADRKEPWTAPELLKLYPFPVKKSPISNLIMRVHHGKFSEMPDFSKLEGVAEEEEHDGYFSLENIKRKQHYALVWSGDIEVPKTAEYVFELVSDDGSALYIDNKLVTQVKGLGAMTNKRKKNGKIKLTKGSHKIKLQYFQQRGGAGIALSWGDASSKKRTLLSKEASPQKRKPVIIDLTPKDAKTRMYHHFIAGSTTRTMGVGFPNGYNIAFSLTDCQPDLIWQGKFISAGRHWIGRGQGFQKPSSSKLISPFKGIPWTANGRNLEVKLLGYTMDKQGNPTFKYGTSALIFSEAYIPSANKLMRKITIESSEEINLTLKLSSLPVTLNNGAADLAGLKISAPNLTAKDEILSSDLKINKGTNTFIIDYSWKK